jgi:hypothetical protein
VPGVGEIGDDGNDVQGRFFHLHTDKHMNTYAQK